MSKTMETTRATRAVLGIALVMAAPLALADIL